MADGGTWHGCTCGTVDPDRLGALKRDAVTFRHAVAAKDHEHARVILAGARCAACLAAMVLALGAALAGDEIALLWAHAAILVPADGAEAFDRFTDGLRRDLSIDPGGLALASA